MNMLKATPTKVIDALIPCPISAVINTKLLSERMMTCPAKILAKRRMVRENGFVKIPINSMVGMSGIALRKRGTSGQKISL